MTKIHSIAASVALAALSSAAQAQISVDIYTGFSDIGGGAPFSGLFDSFDSAGITFATDFGYDWHPSGLGSFGADMKGCISVAADGSYTFSLDSDDGSQLYIDGTLVVDNGGPHSPSIISGSAALTAGTHEFEVQFFEDFGGPSGVDLTLPAGVAYVKCVPDSGSSSAVLMLGMMGLGFYRKFARR